MGPTRNAADDSYYLSLHARYMAGETMRTLTDEAGVTDGALRHWFRARGLPIRPRGRPARTLQRTGARSTPMACPTTSDVVR